MAERYQQDVGLQWIISQVEKPGSGSGEEGRFRSEEDLFCTQASVILVIFHMDICTSIQKIPGPDKYVWNLQACNQNFTRSDREGV